MADQPRREARVGFGALAAAGLVCVSALTLVVTLSVADDVRADLPIVGGAPTDEPQAVIAPQALELAPAQPIVATAAPILAERPDRPERPARPARPESSLQEPEPDTDVPTPSTPSDPAPAPAPDPAPSTPDRPGPVSDVADPVVADVTDAVDGATGGASAPVTGLVDGLVDTVSDVADGLLGGRPGRG